MEMTKKEKGKTERISHIEQLPFKLPNKLQNNELFNYKKKKKQKKFKHNLNLHFCLYDHKIEIFSNIASF